jgi:HEAT repeat protein
MKEDEFQYYIDRIMVEDSFFSLIKAGPEILPKLETQFNKESFPDRRAAITRIIGEYRNSTSLGFLSRALSDPTDIVWKEALDGLVTIGGEEARKIMRSTLSNSNQEKKEWILEALNQITK